MLVLSRRQNDKIVFPNLGITVEILKVAGRSVRVGVAAPEEVSVLRHEIVEQEGHAIADALPAGMLSHRLRNRLHTANLALQLTIRQLERGMVQSAEQTLQKALGEFESLDREIADETQPRPRALLVEDDRNESELLAGFLRLSEFEVDTARDGREALNRLSTEAPPDVVLLDMMMPRLDGPGTVTELRSNPRYEGLRVYAVSGSSPEECGVRTGPHGVDRWFSKPINPERLVREIRRELDACQAG
ncbi:MAG: response regulator [Pirellulaceae bacterium]